MSNHVELFSSKTFEKKKSQINFNNLANKYLNTRFLLLMIIHVIIRKVLSQNIVNSAALFLFLIHTFPVCILLELILSFFKLNLDYYYFLVFLLILSMCYTFTPISPQVNMTIMVLNSHLYNSGSYLTIFNLRRYDIRYV